jgi:hypothetical protein
MILDMVDESDDCLLRSDTKSGIRDVHVLAAAVFGRPFGSDYEAARSCLFYNFLQSFAAA